MSLMRRIMWPRVGEQVTIVQNGRVIVEGHVTYSGNDEVRILDQEADTVILDATELTTGIENRSINVQKKARVH
ncbi:MAG TPA: hypothetical protein VHO69_11940 [Phototrophicaceae bacterium]|nr:hypothetical protein [Phototrophicaceae bacterium]